VIKETASGYRVKGFMHTDKLVMKSAVADGAGFAQATKREALMRFLKRKVDHKKICERHINFANCALAAAEKMPGVIKHDDGVYSMEDDNK